MRVAKTIVVLGAVLVLAAPADLLHADVTMVSADADAYVWKSWGTTNYGSAGNLTVRGGLAGDPGYPINIYLNFDVTNAVPASRTFESATLWLCAYGRWGAPCDISAHEVAGAWTEMGITWNNQPAYDAVPEDTRSLGSGSIWWCGWDVSGAWPGTGDFDIALVHGGGSVGGYIFYSRECGPDPYLEITHIPEPATLSLLAVGGLALVLRRRR